MKFNDVENMLYRFWQVNKIQIQPTDVFRITRIWYNQSGVVNIFLTGHVSKKPFQFYTQLRCDLYSYKKCHTHHMHSTCRNNCTSYKTLVMPGVKMTKSTGPVEPVERINVVKYRRNEHTRQEDKFALDSFLSDTNRVHMQTKLKEGQYVRFVKPYWCVNNKLMESNNHIDELDNIFEVVDTSQLKKEIVPVVASYDIETQSSENKFSNATEDRIISISIIVKRNRQFIKICFYYLRPVASQQNDNDDYMDEEENNEEDMDDYIVSSEQLPDDKFGTTWCVRFTNELNMLAKFFRLFSSINADCIVDYNGDKFDIPYIIQRVKILSQTNTFQAGGRPNPDAVMKIKRYDLEPTNLRTHQLCDKFTNRMNTHFFVYYMHIDLYQFLSSSSDQKDLENYQLNTVAEHFLNKKKVDLPINEMMRLYNLNKMAKIIEYNVQDCILPAELLLKLEIMDFLYTQCSLLCLGTDDVLRNISHVVNVIFFNRSLTNTRYDQRLDKQVPDPYFFNRSDLSVTSGRKKSSTVNYVPFGSPFQLGNNLLSLPGTSNAAVASNSNEEKDDPQVVDLTLLKRQPVRNIPNEAVRLCHQKEKCVYKGGKVLSPQPGLSHWVVTLDFSSLYLTIMIQEGICLSNVFIGYDKYVYLMRNQDAINPKLLKNLLELRVGMKNKRDSFENGSFQYNLYDKAQNAVKRIANSIYGYFGIFFKPLANHVTKIGREKLVEAIKKIEAMSNDETIMNNFNLSYIKFKVIYGDTDSSFIHVQFNENELQENTAETIKTIVNRYVLDKLNSGWTGYKMALENVMTSLILLKKKKYCYLTIENKIKFKGWLVKKDMPLFMRNTFKEIVNWILRKHSLACAANRLREMMRQNYLNFGKNDNYMDYGFSMTYNENTNNKKAKARDDNEPPRKKVITIAKHCRELLANSKTDFLPGNGDRIPYLLIDKEGNITQKAYPLKLFKENHERPSWIKHMGILCNFLNELIEIFGDYRVLEEPFHEICAIYMQNQLFDVKYPMAKPIRVSAPLVKPKKAKKRQLDYEPEEDVDQMMYDHDEENNTDLDEEQPIVPNHSHVFALYKAKYSKVYNRHMVPAFKLYKAPLVCHQCDKEKSSDE